MSRTKIEWSEHVWNPIAGCSVVSPGCHHCYAMRMAGRLEAMRLPKYSGTTKDGRWTGRINLDEEALMIPLRRKKPTTWFVNSMSDLFHEAVPNEFLRRVFAVMSECRQHVFQVLTKRAERMRDYLANPWRRGDTWPLPNVCCGVSVEDQQRADERIGLLLRTPAAMRFLSVEPMLAPINLTSYIGTERQGPISLVIVGGESGPGARPMHPDWVRSIRDQCEAAGVPFFFKQWGAHDARACRVGKKAAGRLLDGRPHDAMPVITRREGGL